MPKAKPLPDKKTLINMIRDSLHLTVLHYGLWFHESEHQLGLEKAIAADGLVWDKILDTTIKRMAAFIKTPSDNGLSETLNRLTQRELYRLSKEMNKNWVACDGMWFQTIEQNYDHEMFNAKRINDYNWVRFSNIEANLIMSRYNLPRNGGLETLKEALIHRQYLQICKFDIEEAPGKLTLKINQCRVQDARKKRGLADYNCKSSGIAEYSYFIQTIDPRITMECITCPPDPHPDAYWCAWEFKMDKSKHSP